MSEQVNRPPKSTKRHPSCGGKRCKLPNCPCPTPKPAATSSRFSINCISSEVYRILGMQDSNGWFYQPACAIRDVGSFGFKAKVVIPSWYSAEISKMKQMSDVFMEKIMLYGHV